MSPSGRAAMPNPTVREEERPLTDQEKMLRRALWAPCLTKDALRRWVRVYLGVDLPDGHVDATSNSSPMELLWEVYNKAYLNDDPTFQNIMGYASRLSFKTLIAAIIEVLCLVHLDRDVVHMSSVIEQSQKCQEYVNGFFNRPYLRDFRTSKNSTYMSIARYIHQDTGESLSPKEYKALLEVQKSFYQEHVGYIDITPCTMAGTNSKHAAFMVIDEVDVIEGEKVKAYEQSRLIPDEQRGKIPITLLISTRKTSHGKVQAEIDDAEKTGLVIRHWNILDVTRPCPESRHRPDLPRTVLYRNEKSLKVLTQEKYDLLEPNAQTQYEAQEAFHGCEHNCELFGPCEGRLATINTERNAVTLKKLDTVMQQFRRVSIEMAVSELLCRKAGSEGLIYPTLDPTVHLLTAAEMAEQLIGEPVAEPFGQEQLIALMLSRDMRPVGGIDFGFSHNFSVVLGFTDGNRIYVVEAGSQPELSPEQQVAMTQKFLQPRDPAGNIRYSARIYADPENPQMVKVLKEAGMHMVKWKKGPGSVLAGIEAVRVTLGSVVGSPRLLFLKGNERVEFFFKRMSQYNWKPDAAGKPSNIPNEVNDDECDCTRYMVMNTLGKYSGLIVAPDNDMEESLQGAAVNIHRQVVGMPGKPPPQSRPVYTPEQEKQLYWNAIAGQVGMPTIAPMETTKAIQGTFSADPRKGRKGTFSYDI